jgi:F-type H+-transporting ATPase subunit b
MRPRCKRVGLMDGRPLIARAINTRLVLACAALLTSAAAPAKEGMPQLNFASPLTTSQVIWGAIIFVLLYVLLSRWALPQVASVVEARHGTIAGDLETARTAKAEADAAVAELTTATRQARAEAQSAIATATQQAKAEAAARAAEMNQRLDAQLSEAEHRIGQARASAMGALRQVATETATVVISRLTGHAPDSAVVDHAVGDLLAASGQG